MALKTSDYTVDEIAEQFYDIIAPQGEQGTWSFEFPAEVYLSEDRA